MLSKITANIRKFGIKRILLQAAALDYANFHGRKRSTLVDFVGEIHAIQWWFHNSCTFAIIVY